ncbi:hypothetical protein ACFV6B_29840 [Streptomyces microflavus]|uniref:hypothetical protein n=1 Tax=Streptomyces microflavus TaxID=1919 RepID=UPI003647D1EE
MLHGMATVFHSAMEQYGGEHVRVPLATYISHHVTPLLTFRASPVPSGALLSATAQLTLLLAGGCVDSGLDRTAQHYLQVASRLAHDAADPTTLAIALRSMVAHAYERGHHGPTVLALAQKAAAIASDTAPAVQAYTQAQLAVILAHHDRSAALVALAHATRFHSLAEAASGPFGSYPPGALHFQRARVFLAMGDTAAGIRALTASLHLRTPFEHRATVLTHAYLAEAHLRLGHVEPTVHHCLALLDGITTLHSARASDRLRSLRVGLHPHARQADVAEFLNASERFV